MAATISSAKTTSRHGGRYCVAGGPNQRSCNNSQFTKGISMHMFPKNPMVRKQWTAFVRRHRHDFVPTSSSCLCSAHFDTANFHRPAFAIADAVGGRRKLLPNAVPTLDCAGEIRVTVPQKRADRQRYRRQIVRRCLGSSAAQLEVKDDSSETESASSEAEPLADMSNTQPAVAPAHSCRCSELRQKVISLQKKLSWYRKTKSTLQDLVQNASDTDSSDDEEESERSDEGDVDMIQDMDSDEEEEEQTSDVEWEADSQSDSETEEAGTSDKANYIYVEAHTEPHNEPKFVVFYGMLMQIFSLFCFRCTTPRPEVRIERNGTMATVTQFCKSCESSFQWRSQPFIFGKYPAGNLMLSFGILMSGVSINKALLLFKHMGLYAISVRTYFIHQRKFLFPAILHYWEQYQATLIQRLRNLKDVTWSGDGRFDSMGHNAKYGVYTMFCNSICKIVHFELLQSNQCGSSNAMELEGAKRCFSFLTKVGLKIRVFISDRHCGIAKWVKNSHSSISHFYDIWHVSKGFTKKMLKASKEKGCEQLKDWVKGLRNHMYWSATSTQEGFGEMIVAKWLAVIRHVTNKHDNHPNQLFTRCCHGVLQPRLWIKIGTAAFDKLHSLVTNTRTVNDIKKLSNDAQTSCLEGFNSTLNHWHPKMTHFSWLGTYCRHVLGVLHFNENLHRASQTSKGGHTYYNVKYPKYKLGEEIVKKVAVPPTYDYVQQVSQFMFHTDRNSLRETHAKYLKMVPEALTGQFHNKLSKEEAIARQQKRQSLTTTLFPNDERQTMLKQALDSETVAKKRSHPSCKTCGKSMKGHKRANCTQET